MNCVHEKVYSGECWRTAVPQWAWICAACRETGRDFMREQPPHDFERYVTLLVDIDPEDAAAMQADAG